MKVRPLLASTIIAVLLLASAESDLAESAPWGTASTPPWTIEKVESGGRVGAYVSVAIDPKSDTTYISYFDTATDDLRVARYVGSGGNCGPANDWACEVVDASVQGGRYSSIAIDPSTGLPAVAYHEATRGALKYAAYACDGSCGWVVHTIDPKTADHVNGEYASLDYLDGPYIAYRRSGSFDDLVMLARHTGANGNCGPNGDTWQCEMIDPPVDRVRYSSLSTAAEDGAVRIAYYAPGTGLQLATEVGAGNGDCGLGHSWLCETIYLDPDAGQYTSLVAGSSSPRIAYYDGSNGQLRLATYVDFGGNCGENNDWQCEAIDSMGTSDVPDEPKGLAMTMDGSGLPVIAYQDLSGGLAPKGLKVARPVQALPSATGNCGPSLDWVCETVDAGGAHFDEANFVGVAVDSSGWLTVAYYEHDNYHLTSNLKVAYQRLFTIYLPVVLRNA